MVPPTSAICCAPFLILHGDKNNFVPLGQSELLRAVLKKAGVESAFFLVMFRWKPDATKPTTKTKNP